MAIFFSSLSLCNIKFAEELCAIDPGFESDATFLVASAQAALLGIVVPITTALADRNDVTGTNGLLRDARFRLTKVYVFVLSASLLLITCGTAESFGTATHNYYLAQILWFIINLLLFIRIILVQIDRDSYTATFAEEFADKLETGISQMAVQKAGDRFDG